jgi:hypothetical protein
MAKKAMSMCCDANKMCALTCCQCNIDLKQIRPLVNDAKYICKQCGRVANKAENLCNPAKL